MDERFFKPKLVFSRCFYERTRYDGGEIKDEIIERLKPFVEPILVCPEVEIGLPIPRPRVHIIQETGSKRLVQGGTGLDLTERMRTFCKAFLENLLQVDGFILKAKSPSCGLGQAKFYCEGKMAGKTYGFFAEEVKRLYPYHPAIDEGRLKDRDLREHFLTQVFALAELRHLIANPSPKGLVEFHTKHKFLLLAISQKGLQDLGRLVALGDISFEEKLRQYEVAFRSALSKRGTRKTHYNTLLHMIGYFSKNLNRRERLYLHHVLEKFRRGVTPLWFVRELIKTYALRFELEYLLKQSYLYPFPEELDF